MKKRLSILILFVTICSVVVHNLIPHHHHGDKICMEMGQSFDLDSEHYSENNQKHHSDNNQNGCDENCSLKDKLLVKINNNQEDINDISDLLPICDILINYISFLPEAKERKIKYNKYYLFAYTPEYFNTGNSLRAPPSL